MTTDPLRAFLDRLGLGAYHDALAAERIEPADIALLSDADLAALGLPLGPRRRLMNAVAPERAPAPPPAPPAAGEGERRNLTVLFVDMVGSTAIAERLDPEDLRALFHAYRDTCVAAIEAGGGYVAHSLGDGLMAHFGFPRALEDAAERAVRAGLELVARVGDIALPGGPVQARVGIASGLTVVEEALSDSLPHDEMATGATLALAARLQALAPPGGVVVSDATRLLLRGAFALRPIGEEAVKGFSNPVAIWQANAPAHPQSRFDAAHATVSPALLGRDAERAALLAQWRDAVRGAGSAVLLTGDAGIGKSRLLAELRDAAAAEGEVVVLQCSTYRPGVALHPVTDWIAATIGRAGDADRATRAARLGRLPGVTQAMLGPLAGLMGLEEQQEAGEPRDALARQAAILGAVTALLAHAPPGRVRMVLIEDVHWADTATLDLIDRLAARARDTALLIAATARADAVRLPQGPGLRQIALEPLRPDAITALIGAQPGADRLPERLCRTILERAGGVPLFIEELTRAVLEAPEADAAVVPMTLQDTLMARLDRLETGKPVAQLAALIGRRFSTALLEACADLPGPRLQRGLAELVVSGVVEAQPGEGIHAFRHALMRDAAYGSLLRSRRTALHRRVARALEERFPALSQAQPDILAHHHTEAGDIEAAIPCWERAAEHAIAQAAPTSAISHFTRALELLGRLPPSAARDGRETALRIRLNMPLTVTTGFASAGTEANLARLAELSGDAPPGEAALQLVFSRCMSALVRADLGTARTMALRMTEVAQCPHLPDAWRVPERMLGYIALLEGELDVAEGHFDRALAAYAPQGFDPILPGHPFDVLAASLSYRAILMALRGRPASLARDEAAALARARALDSPATSFQVLVHLCLARFELADHAGVVPLLRELRTVVDRHEVAPLYAELWEAWLEARHGALDDGLGRMARAEAAGTQYPLWMPGALLLRAGLLADARRHREALAVLETCATDIRRTRHGYLSAQLARQRAVCLAALEAPAAQVQALLAEAISIARRQGARRVELAARLDLARHHLDLGDAAAAATTLGPARALGCDAEPLPEHAEACALLQGLPAGPPVAAGRG